MISLCWCSSEVKSLLMSVFFYSEGRPEKHAPSGAPTQVSSKSVGPAMAPALPNKNLLASKILQKTL